LKPTVISLFSGCGGMNLGFKNAGFNIVWANDFYKDAVNTYKKNIGNHIVLGDIPSNEIPDNPDVLLGGFPCQGFSVANTNRDPNDNRNFLYKEMVRIIKDKKPFFDQNYLEKILAKSDFFFCVSVIFSVFFALFLSIILSSYSSETNVFFGYDSSCFLSSFVSVFILCSS